MNDTIKHLEESRNERIGEVQIYDFVLTTQRNKNSDLFSTFNVKIKPHIPTTLENDITPNMSVDKTISILDDYYSGQKITHSNKYKENSKPHSSHSWAKFTNIQVPCVNSREGNHRSYGLIIGLTPQIHGRHHKTCRWIIQQMFEQLKEYLDPDLNCKDHLLFRNKFGIRPGNYTPTYSKPTPTSHQVYHIHSENDNNIRQLVGSFVKHANNERKFFKIFNVRVTLSRFPNGQDKQNTENKLCTILSRTHKNLSGLISITINSSIKTTLTEDDIKTIEGQTELVTYSLIAEKGGVRAKLHLNNTNVTSHFKAKDFKHFLDSPEEEKLRHNSSFQIEPPRFFWKRKKKKHHNKMIY